MSRWSSVTSSLRPAWIGSWLWRRPPLHWHPPSSHPGVYHSRWETPPFPLREGSLKTEASTGPGSGHTISVGGTEVQGRHHQGGSRSSGLRGLPDTHIFGGLRMKLKFPFAPLSWLRDVITLQSGICSPNRRGGAGISTRERKGTGYLRTMLFLYTKSGLPHCSGVWSSGARQAHLAWGSPRKFLWVKPKADADYSYPRF